MEKYKVNINEQVKVKDMNYETFIFEDNDDNNKNALVL